MPVRRSRRHKYQCPGSATTPALWLSLVSTKVSSLAMNNRAVADEMHEPASFARLRLMAWLRTRRSAASLGLIKHKIWWRMIG
jgi:hypothetical protein